MERYSFFTNPIGWLFQDNRDIQPPNTSGGGNNIVQPLNLTTVTGYLILGGLVYYFGRKLLK